MTASGNCQYSEDHVECGKLAATFRYNQPRRDPNNINDGYWLCEEHIHHMRTDRLLARPDSNQETGSTGTCAIGVKGEACGAISTHFDANVKLSNGKKGCWICDAHMKDVAELMIAGKAAGRRGRRQMERKQAKKLPKVRL